MMAKLLDGHSSAVSKKDRAKGKDLAKVQVLSQGILGLPYVRGSCCPEEGVVCSKSQEERRNIEM